jgi:DNA repair protein RadC
MENTLGISMRVCEAAIHQEAIGPPLECEARETLGQTRPSTLRRTVFELEAQVLTSGEILYRLLSAMLPEPDALKLSRELLARFGTLGAVLSADAVQLARLTGDVLVEHLHAIQLALQEVLREQVRTRSVIDSWLALEDYLAVRLRHCPIEKTLVMFLDKKNHLIHDEIMQWGTVDHTPLYPAEIARRALELYASAVILVHNHPSGDPTPSRADVAMTKKVIAALAVLDIVLHDHAIVCRDMTVSMRSLHLI